MLIDKSLVTMDGTELNKIGVSFFAFRNEPNACYGHVGDGLRNQPDDYYQVRSSEWPETDLFQSDLAKQTAGQVGDYFVGNFGQPVFDVANPQERSLGYILQQPQSSVITLFFVADSLQYIINVYADSLDGQCSFIAGVQELSLLLLLLISKRCQRVVSSQQQFETQEPSIPTIQFVRTTQCFTNTCRSQWQIVHQEYFQWLRKQPVYPLVKKQHCLLLFDHKS